MKIEILGGGCANCKKLYENVVEALRLTGTEAQVIKVQDLKQIASYGVMTTPAVVIDGVVKSSGKVLSPDQVKALL